MEDQLEVIAFLTGIAGIWLTMHEKIWCFPVGLINVSISMVIFYQQHLYADALQQIMYITLLIFGWYNWNGKKKTSDKFEVGRLSIREKVRYSLIILLSAFIIGLLLKTLTNAIFPWADSFATATAFVAQYLIARKKIENWYLWMIVNMVYIAIYFHKGLDLYTVLFGIYLVLSFGGYFKWKKAMEVSAKTLTK